MNERTVPAGWQRRPVNAAVACLLAVGALTGCTGTQPPTAHAAPGGPTAGLPFDVGAHTGLTARLAGSGSSFQEKYLHAAIGTLDNVLDGLAVTYAGGGSGQGKSDLVDGLVAFAGTDSPLEPEALERIGGPVVYLPTVIAPITVAHGLDDVDDLRLDGPTLAGIFTTSITRWDDPRVAATNPDVELPATPITVCRRSDASGTTVNFSRYLASAGGEAWSLGVGDALAWPPGTRGAAGNGGVARCVGAGTGAIGYVDLADAVAQDLTVARIRNRAGRYVAPTLTAASAAARTAEVDDDLIYDPIDVDGAEAYPITSPTWVVVRADQPDAETAHALRVFAEFLLTDGRDPSFTASVQYAPVPDRIADRALARLERIGPL